MNAPPWSEVVELPPAQLPALRRQAAFTCGKWDQQVGDVATFAPFALTVRADVWATLRAEAEALAAETMAAERELAGRSDLWARLGLPAALRRPLRRAATPAPASYRLMRFDFHWTTAGWAISEVNSDVPGGLNEASGYPALVAPFLPGTAPAGDVTAALAEAVWQRPPARRVALVYATGYSDDRQVMKAVADRLAAAGGTTVLCSPANLRWRDGRAEVQLASASGPVDHVLRFFPAEWMPDLPRACGWPHFFGGAVTPVGNPASALLTQSKRFPLVWDQLAAPLRAWRRLLPETRDPRAAPWRADDQWLLKPALGRVGEGIAWRGRGGPREWTSLARWVRLLPGRWAAQRRFEDVVFAAAGATWRACFGVYTVDGRAAGLYVRATPGAVVDQFARDVPVRVGEKGAAS